MASFDRLREARAQAQSDAIRRYIDRAPERDHNKAIVEAQGPGAADTQERQDQFRRRIAGLRAVRSASSRVLPIGVERRMGASIDWTSGAPSDQARIAGRPVARIVEEASPGIVPRGIATGFMIAPDLLMTNWHVFPSRADASDCAANFLYERSERGLSQGVTFPIDATTFYVSDEKLDFAIVAVAARSQNGDVLADLGQVSLIEARPKILVGHAVNIIQYPEGGEKQYAVSMNRLVDILEDEGFLHYETDTLEGSSGSPAFSDQWELVALHHAAIPRIRDGRVVARDNSFWTSEMGDDAVEWIANEGAKVSSIVARLHAIIPASVAEQAILRGLLDSTTDPLPAAVQAAAEAVGGAAVPERTAVPQAEAAAAALLPARQGATPSINFTFTGPVTINVMAAPAVSPATPERETANALGFAAPERAIRFDPNYEARKGYSPTFLDSAGKLAVPTPTIAAARRGEILNGDNRQPLVLKYHHFELVMNRKRRLQMWSAANIDYDPKRKTDRERSAWGSDRWVPDPRVPAADQIFDADFYKPAGNIDRGHMVRREDNEWGDTEQEIEFANSDTFHWTNCTPQHEAFNQSDPARNNRAYRGMEGLWGAFENHIQQSRTDGDTKACLLAGPILADDDPSADFGRGPIQYPLRFWKIVCVAARTRGILGLQVFGFILSQEDVVERFGIERFSPGQFKRYQTPLTEIAAEAGLVFDKRLLDKDTMAGLKRRQLASVGDMHGLA